MENHEVDVTNIWVAIVTILLALSLISERISNLIKLWVPSWREKIYGEKIQERNVLMLALISGWIVAFFSGADFFILIGEGKLVKIKDLTFLGVFLSGIFISLGSKFWHDVLDIVLQFSRLKKFKRLREEEGFEKERFSYLESKEKEQRLEYIIRNNMDKLKEIDNYGGYNIVHNGDRFIVILKFNDKIPKKDDITWINEYLNSNEYKIQLTSITELSGG